MKKNDFLVVWEDLRAIEHSSIYPSLADAETAAERLIARGDTYSVVVSKIVNVCIPRAKWEYTSDQT